jgi:acyl-CoA thioesterase-1
MLFVEPVSIVLLTNLLAKYAKQIHRRLGPALCAFLLFVALPLAHAADQAAAHSIVFLGDSLSAGLGVDPSEAFPALVQDKITAAGWHDRVVNAGVSGDTSADGLGRIDWLLKQKIDVLILELGGNDGLRGFPLAATQTNLQAIIDRVKQKYPQVRIIIAGMMMPPNMGPEYDTAFQKLYPDLAAANHAALIPFLLDGVGGKPELNQEDHIHPNVAGHKIVADNIWKVLQPVLQQLHAGP